MIEDPAGAGPSCGLARGLACGLDSALCQHPDEVRAIGGGAVLARDQVICAGLHPLDRVGGRVRRQGRLGLCPAEDAVVGRPGDRDAHAVGVFGDKDADEGEA